MHRWRRGDGASAAAVEDVQRGAVYERALGRRVLARCARLHDYLGVSAGRENINAMVASTCNVEHTRYVRRPKSRAHARFLPLSLSASGRHLRASKYGTYTTSTGCAF